jgi:pimeloyl-ACP methyl ester carboxylesterase
MPGPVRSFLAANLPRNVLDVRGAFAEVHAPERLARLALPILVAYGSRSPAVTRRIALLLAGCVPDGAVHEIDGATHAMPTTRAEAVAALVMERAVGWRA